MPKERLTWSQIVERYPDQWVRIEDAEMDPANDATILAGVVTKAGEMDPQDYLDTYDGICSTCFVDSGRIPYMGAAV